MDRRLLGRQVQSSRRSNDPLHGNPSKGDVGHGYNNFKIAAELKEGEHKGFWWHDGDFYKWMEASVYIYGVNKDEKILKELDEIIEVIGMAQQEDGYLSTPITIKGIKPFPIEDTTSCTTVATC